MGAFLLLSAPDNSKTLISKEINLHDIQIIKFQKTGEIIIIICDTNSRLGNEQEQWVDVSSTSDDTDVDFINIELPIRFCQYTTYNTYGSQLLEILNECHLLILNGIFQNYGNN